MIPLARGTLTTLFVADLVNSLVNSEILVGRGSAPTPGGWQQGQPGKGVFVPYVVVKTGSARPSANARDPIGIDGYTWDVGYTLYMVGVTDSQSDDVADQVRAATAAFGRKQAVDLRGTTWTLDKLGFTSYGSTNRNDSVDPPYWELSDTVSFWLARSR
jgi:hypothetical protein